MGAQRCKDTHSFCVWGIIIQTWHILGIYAQMGIGTNLYDRHKSAVSSPLPGRVRERQISIAPLHIINLNSSFTYYHASKMQTSFSYPAVSLSSMKSILVPGIQ